MSSEINAQSQSSSTFAAASLQHSSLNANQAQVPPADLNLEKLDSNFMSFLMGKILVVLVILAAAAIIMLFNLVLCIVFIIGSLILINIVYKRNLFRSLAKANHFSFRKHGIIPKQTGYIFFSGKTSKISDVVSGSFLGRPFLLFVFSYVVIHGETRHFYTRTVASVEFDNKNLPTFILKRDPAAQSTNKELKKLGMNGYTERLDLGDKFMSFAAFVPPNLDGDVRSVLTPDVLELLVPLNKYELELTPSGVLYVYGPKRIRSKKELSDIDRIIRAVSVKLENPDSTSL